MTIPLDQYSKVSYSLFLFYCIPIWGLSVYIENQLQTTCCLGGGGWGNYGVEKFTTLNLKGINKFLINSTIFATFTFLVSVLLCHNLGSNMLKCEGSLTQIIKFSLESIVCSNNYMKYITLRYPIFLTISPTICQIKSLLLHFSQFKNSHPSLLQNK